MTETTTGTATETTLTTDTESFHRFLEFPQEIQDLIWEFACQGAVETFLKGPLFTVDQWWKNTNYTFAAYHPVLGWNPIILDVYRLPRFAPILHTCRFSRLVALNWWKCVTRYAVVWAPDTGNIHRHLMDKLKEHIADVRASIYEEERVYTPQ